MLALRENLKIYKILHPNPLDRSLWRLVDYKNEMKNLKETYADSGNIDLSRYFIQVNLGISVLNHSRFNFFISHMD